ncbi:MAG: DMT family transporter [Firmicutes bacterium]|jgi:transporter family-2 protein|nr:DMT family transporter [Bacillota bacterium]
MFVLALAAAAISGALMAIQGTLNSGLSKVLGLLEASFVVHVIGSLTGAVLLLFGLGQGNWRQAFQAPWFTYLGGILGIGIVLLVALAIGEVGAASATTAIIVGQVGTAVVIDLFGWFGMEKAPFSYLKVVGVFLLAVGAWLLLYRPK